MVDISRAYLSLSKKSDLVPIQPRFFRATNHGLRMSLTRFRIHQYMHPFTQNPVIQTRRTEHFENKQGDSTGLENKPSKL